MADLFMQHSSEFHKRPFESAVGSIRTIAANHLWQVVLFKALFTLLIFHCRGTSPVVNFGKS